MQLNSIEAAISCTIACIIANYAESVLGATVQGRVEWLSNDMVNMLQISFAAVLAVAFVVAFGGGGVSS